jgi:hypothetical protein
MTATFALYLYRTVFAAFIVWASAKTFVEGWPSAHGGSGGHMGLFIRALAATEIVAALLFLWRPAQVWAGAALIAIFAIAVVVDLAHKGVPARFAYYSATVLIVLFLDARLRAAPAIA